MIRRSFIRLGLLGTLLSLGRTRTETKPDVPSLILGTVHVAGIVHHHAFRSGIVRSFTVGQQLELVREPTNRFDANAIAIYTRTGIQVGYVPRYANASPASLIDQGAMVWCEILHLDLTAAPWEMIQVRLILTRTT